MTWPHKGKVQLASDNTHLADLRTLPMPRADHAFIPAKGIGGRVLSKALMLDMNVLGI